MATGIRLTLASNVRKMIDASAPEGEGVSIRSWAMSKGLEVRLIDRMVKGENAVTLDTLEVVATKCQVPVWQLLHPDFDPAASASFVVSTHATAEDIEFLKKLRRFLEK